MPLTPTFRNRSTTGAWRHSCHCELTSRLSSRRRRWLFPTEALTEPTTLTPTSRSSVLKRIILEHSLLQEFSKFREDHECDYYKIESKLKSSLVHNTTCVNNNVTMQEKIVWSRSQKVKLKSNLASVFFSLFIYLLIRLKLVINLMNLYQLYRIGSKCTKMVGETNYSQGSCGHITSSHIDMYTFSI